MAEKIVQPKVKNTDGSYDELVFQKSVYANYASEDTSKGTIEERLTKLGHREGEVSFFEDLVYLEGSYAKLIREGNIVLFDINVRLKNQISTKTIIGSFSGEFSPNFQVWWPISNDFILLITGLYNGKSNIILEPITTGSIDSFGVTNLGWFAASI